MFYIVPITSDLADAWISRHTNFNAARREAEELHNRYHEQYNIIKVEMVWTTNIIDDFMGMTRKKESK